MPLNPDAVGATSEPTQVSWTSKDTLLYAVSLGAGTNELQYTTENTKDVAQQALPTFHVVIPGGGGVMRLATDQARSKGALTGACFLELEAQPPELGVDFFNTFQENSRHFRQKWFEAADFCIFNVDGVGTLEEVGIEMCNLKLGIRPRGFRCYGRRRSARKAGRRKNRRGGIAGGTGRSPATRHCPRRYRPRRVARPVYLDIRRRRLCRTLGFSPGAVTRFVPSPSERVAGGKRLSPQLVNPGWSSGRACGTAPGCRSIPRHAPAPRDRARWRGRGRAAAHLSRRRPRRRDEDP